jgi:heat shock protein HtpX
MIGINRVKTWVLLAALAGLFVAIGAAVGGRQGALVALLLAFGFNLVMYWASDRIAVMATRSHPVAEAEAPQLYTVVRELAAEARAPVPRIYISEMAQPNAFATGRNPEHAVVAVTRGILQVLDRRELRAVLAHELSHVMNRDILVNTVAAAIASAFTYLAYMVFFFGGDDDSPLGGLGFVLLWLVAPVAAMLIQMAVSRSREFQADESGALLSRDPDALASALLKLEQSSKVIPAQVNPAQAHLFIVNPLRSGGVAGLFSTHPPTEERIRRLREIADRAGMGALRRG